ncbi:MAG: hypothetical protein GY769_15565 [bacterium]|nr:hypothetical protein [bacterium]
MTRLAVVEQNLAMLRDGLALVNGLADDVYVAEDIGAGSGLGPHIRHVIEFYRALFEGLPAGRVDYDRRDRDREIERRRGAATAAIEDIIVKLETVELNPDVELLVNVDAPITGEPAIWSRSSVLRELQFALSHTIHHYALIARQLRDRGVDPGADFGMAPSTIAAREVGAG